MFVVGVASMFSFILLSRFYEARARSVRLPARQWVWFYICSLLLARSRLCIWILSITFLPLFYCGLKACVWSAWLLPMLHLRMKVESQSWILMLESLIAVGLRSQESGRRYVFLSIPAFLCLGDVLPLKVCGEFTSSYNQREEICFQ